MGTINNYRDLDVWHKAIELVKEIYIITKSFPKDEMYGLVNQMRRAAVSIPSNIAEGKTRQTINEYTQFLYIALGSIAEVETQITISRELKYINGETEKRFLAVTNHIMRMTRSLIKNLKSAKVFDRQPSTVNQ